MDEPICPLLFDQDEGVALNCQGRFCAWAILVNDDKSNPIYRCAIAEIAIKLS